MLPRFLLALLALTVASDLAAQSASDLSMSPAVIGHWDHLKGAHVRVRPLGRNSTDAPTVEGTVVEAHADSLYLAVAGRDVPTLVVVDGSADVQEWYRADPTKAATIGGIVVGMVLGGVAANAVNRPPPPTTCTGSYDPVGGAMCAIGAAIATGAAQAADQAAAVFLGALVGGTVGGVLGRHLGHKSIREGWRSVSLRRIDIQPTRRGGVQIGAQLRF